MNSEHEIQKAGPYILGVLKRQQRDQRVIRDLRKTKKLNRQELKDVQQIYDCSRASVHVAALQAFCEEEDISNVAGLPTHSQPASRNDFNWYAELLIPDLSDLPNRSRLGVLTAGLAGELVWHGLDPLTFLTDYMKLDSNHSPDFHDLSARWNASMNDASLEELAEDFSFLFYQWADRNKQTLMAPPLVEGAKRVILDVWPEQALLENPWRPLDVVQQSQSKVSKPQIRIVG